MECHPFQVTLPYLLMLARLSSSHTVILVGWVVKDLLNRWIDYIKIKHNSLLFSTTALEEVSLGNSVSLLAVNSLNSRGCEGNALPQSYSINSKPITQLKVLNNRHFSLQMNGRHCMCLKILGEKTTLMSN